MFFIIVFIRLSTFREQDFFFPFLTFITDYYVFAIKIQLEGKQQTKSKFNNKKKENYRKIGREEEEEINRTLLRSGHSDFYLV